MLKRRLGHIRTVLLDSTKLIVLSVRVLWLFFFVLAIRLFLILKNQKPIIVGLYEHIGDVISCEPVLHFLTNTHKRAGIIWIINKDYRELVEHHPNVFKVIGIKYFSEWILLRSVIEKTFRKQKIVDLHLSPKTCSQFRYTLVKNNFGVHRSNYLSHRSQLQAFSLAAGLPALTAQPRFFCTLDHSTIYVDHPYVVFHTASNMKTKDWEPAKWDLLFYEIQKFGFKIVEVGLEKCISVKSPDYIDYTGKRSLQKIASIIKNAQYFIGIDSGFAHMANSLDKEGLVLIGEYHIEEFRHRHYNPFSGKYRHPKHIVYSDVEGLVNSIPVEKVLAAFKTLVEAHSTNAEAN